MPASRPTIHLPTVEAYNKWAPTYDHDGNILQLLDDHAFAATMPTLLQMHPPTHLLDLGCGTGRTTSKLHAALPPTTRITALDASPAMMALAQSRLPPATSPHLRWVLHDLSAGLPPLDAVDAVVSTLVLEHLGDLDRFFGGVAGVLRSGGWMWVTSMHPQMGAVACAGFVDAREGAKVHGVSWNHQVEEVLAAAARAGLRLRGEVGVRGVKDREEAERLGARAAKWVGVLMHVEMLFFMD